jgi:hypothetical protein
VIEYRDFIVILDDNIWMVGWLAILRVGILQKCLVESYLLPNLWHVNGPGVSEVDWLVGWIKKDASVGAIVKERFFWLFLSETDDYLGKGWLAEQGNAGGIKFWGEYFWDLKQWKMDAVLDGTEVCLWMLLSCKMSPDKERNQMRPKGDRLSNLGDFGTMSGVKLPFPSNSGGYQSCHAGVVLLLISNKGLETTGARFIVNLLALMLEEAWR